MEDMVLVISEKILDPELQGINCLIWEVFDFFSKTFLRIYPIFDDSGEQSLSKMYFLKNSLYRIIGD